MIAFAREDVESGLLTRATATAATASNKTRKKMTLRTLQHMYMTGTPISMLTAYDFNSAR